MITLKGYTAHSDQGPFLQVNEDTVVVDLANKLFLLLDGFGGGAVVSGLAEEIKSFYTKLGGDPDATLPFFFSHKYLLEGNALINSMHHSHERLAKENAQREASLRGGASCIAGVMADNIMTFVATGNCAGFLSRGDELSLICRPDNTNGTPASPASGLGLFEDFHFEVCEIKVLEKDFFALLSDGVYSRLEQGEIASVLKKTDSPNWQKAKELFDLANSRGNLDNQSALFLQF